MNATNEYRSCGNFTLFWDAPQWFHLLAAEDSTFVVPVGNFPAKAGGLTMRDFKKAAKPITLSVKVRVKKRKRVTQWIFSDCEWSLPLGSKRRDVAGVLLYVCDPANKCHPLGFIGMGYRIVSWPTYPGDAINLRWGRPAIDMDLK